MKRPEPGMNPAIYEAYDKLIKSVGWGGIKNDVLMMVRAHFQWGPLSAITINNELNLYRSLRSVTSLSSYERDILWVWLRQEPKRIQEAKDNGRKEDKLDAAD